MFSGHFQVPPTLKNSKSKSAKAFTVNKRGGALWSCGYRTAPKKLVETVLHEGSERKKKMGRVISTYRCWISVLLMTFWTTAVWFHGG